MKILLVFSAIIGVIYGANTMCWTLDQISNQVIMDTDLNKDGILQQDELTTELINKWSLSNDSCLSFHDFTTNWMANYHDHRDTAHAFFNNLDLNGDGKLCILDVAVQIVTYDQQPTDGQIQPEEFINFMHAVHPDSHQNGGHGHGC